MDVLEKNFIQFFKKFDLQKAPFLLGFSGGSDSTLLFYLLDAYKIPFHVAHVDHGARKESREEAQELEVLCKEKGIPFHLKVLEFAAYKKNLESEWRQKRLEFFRSLYDKCQFQALLLGHHADDQAETVLKRVFEGAGLISLKGLMPFSSFEGMPIYRPLLEIRKSEILRYSKEKNLSFFEDSTNQEKRFLRGRMRKELLPSLSASFGKEIATSLCRLGHHARELSEFFDHVLSNYRKLVKNSDNAFELDCTLKPPETSFLWRLVIRDFFSFHAISLSSKTLDSILNHLKKKSRNKKVVLGKRKIKMDKGILFLEKKCVDEE